VINFTIVSAVVDDSNSQLLGAADMEIVTIGSEKYLFVAAEADGAVSSYRLSATLPPQRVDTLAYSATSGTLAVGQITVTDVNGVLTLLPSARYDDDVVPYQIGSLGTIDAPVSQPQNGAAVSRFTTSEAVVIGGKTYLYAAERGVPGFSGYWMQPGDSFSSEVTYSGNSLNYLGDIADFTSVKIGAQTYLFTASAFDAGLNSFSVGANGSLQLADSVAPADASGFSLPQALDTITVGGQAYLLMASAGTNSLTVYAVDANGGLSETDHLIDTVGTRFQDASVLESFHYNSHSYVLAAGSDDGLTLLELNPDGTLTFLSVLADDFNTTLKNITDIEVVQFGTDLQAFVSSGVENGFTQIAITIEPQGQTIVGSGAHETLTGTALGDTISGMGGSDRMYGGDGADVMQDGSGRDHFFGGAGADVFQFVQDGTLDLIRDYEPGVDKIDLSLLAGVTGMSSLTIEAHSYGASIFAGGEEISIETVDQTGLTAFDFTANDFIF